MKKVKRVAFADPELEKSWNRAIRAMRKSGTHLYPYRRGLVK